MPLIRILGRFASLNSQQGRVRFFTLCALCASALFLCFAISLRSVSAIAQEQSPAFRGQSQEEADRKSAGCISCHTSTDEPTMHPTKTVHLGCTDCHGGNSSISIAAGITANSSEYESAKEKAHVQPRDPKFKARSALPERVYTKWLKESADYIKFVNPGDLRVAPDTCGASGCHACCFHEHDDARRAAVGRGAIQQRRLSHKEYAVRGEL
jgi:hypothetical protein